MTEPGAEPPPPPPPPSPEPPRPLRRSRTDRVIGGVCGGLGRHFGIDAVLLRIAFVILVFAGGSGLLIYLLAWVLIPDERPGEEIAPAPMRGDDGRGAEIVGLGLIGLGAFLLLKVILPDVFDDRYVWPAVLIVLGAVLLLRGARR